MTEEQRRLLNEKRKKYTNENKSNWLNVSNETFAKFASSLAEIPNNSVRKASKRIKKNIALQKDRLKMFNLTMKNNYSTSDNDRFFERHNNTNDNYTNTLCYKGCCKQVEYYTNEKRINQFSNKSILYANIVNSKDRKIILNDTFNCPNCGAVNMIKDLDAGCQYCNTKFMFDDIYPVVKSYYTTFDFGLTLPSIKTIGILCYLVGTIIAFIALLTKKYATIKLIICSLLYGLLLTPIIYMIISFLLLISFFIRLLIGSKYTPPLKVLSSKRKIKSLLLKYDPNTIYESFEGLVISYLKGIIFSPDCTKLSYYTGENNSFNNIVNLDYLGGMYLNEYNLKDNILTMKLVVYMLDTVCENNKLYQQKHPYNVTISKDIRIVNDSSFSIEKISCKSCGGSFDAEYVKNCPYCDSEFNLINYDYVISEVK